MRQDLAYSRPKQIAEIVRGFWRRISHDRLTVFAMTVLVFFIVLALVPQVIAPYSPTSIQFEALQPPSSVNWLGTDDLGRDVWSRLVWGSRVSILFGVLAASISMALGVPLGLLSGYLGGGVDQVLSRIFEIVLMIPAFFLLVMVVAIFGNDITLEVIVVGITIWPANARIMRASVLSLKERQFVRAAVATGSGHPSIVGRHIIPNAIQPVIVNSNLQIGQAILFEAGMSFLGLGDPNVISWGQMVQVGAFHLLTAWWLAVFPGIALTFMILSFNLMGEGIGKAFKPVEVTRAEKR